MEVRRPNHHGLWRHEEGFTLGEVLVTIIIMGILASMAISLWWNVVESRRVDSAANQLASDLRFAHENAENRFTSYRINVPAANSQTYEFGSVADFTPPGTPETRTLPERTEIAATTTITFKSDGSATLPGGAPSATLTVSSDDGDPSIPIEVNAATSRVQVD